MARDVPRWPATGRGGLRRITLCPAHRYFVWSVTPALNQAFNAQAFNAQRE
jgi:hypothetical protein